MVTRRISSWLCVLFSLSSSSSSSTECCSWCGCYAYKLMKMWTSFEWSAFFFHSPLSFCLFILIVFLNYNDSRFFVLSLACARSSACVFFSYFFFWSVIGHIEMCTNGISTHTYIECGTITQHTNRIKKICISIEMTNRWQFTKSPKLIINIWGVCLRMRARCCICPLHLRINEAIKRFHKYKINKYFSSVCIACLSVCFCPVPRPLELRLFSDKVLRNNLNYAKTGDRK